MISHSAHFSISRISVSGWANLGNRHMNPGSEGPRTVIVISLRNSCIIVQKFHKIHHISSYIKIIHRALGKSKTALPRKMNFKSSVQHKVTFQPRNTYTAISVIRGARWPT
jgi:hypothetical protein